MKDCASLGRALQTLPLLADALTGDDGGRPIGRVAALLVARVASADSLAAWVTLARRVPIRALRDAVRASRAAGSDSPADVEARAGDDPQLSADTEVPPEDGLDDLSDRTLVRILVPAPRWGRPAPPASPPTPTASL